MLIEKTLLAFFCTPALSCGTVALQLKRWDEGLVPHPNFLKLSAAYHHHCQ